MTKYIAAAPAATAMSVNRMSGTKDPPGRFAPAAPALGTSEESTVMHPALLFDVSSQSRRTQPAASGASLQVKRVLALFDADYHALLFGAHLSISGGLHNALLAAEKWGMDTVQIFTKNQMQW